ncbi:hypothetical protein HPP92_005829 [Vanilla planifolia]|uniref:eIF3a PCI domain-containing protein n=1 Tax=Vanilla planifolia TaxID=51239 RepID=A0A835VDJ2_VANPL|nr:hypothetical protein HPP92_005829 [Vanilla planifolia]
MQLATERAEQAKNQAEALEDALDVEDLEADKRPEDLMLKLYDGTSKAFQFCKQYKRTTEFSQRLCEIIRNHLANLNKYRDQRDRPDLTAPESLQLYLDTRMDQLKIATDLELWQEAFRSVEDIHGLMSMLSREALLSELYSRGVMTCVSQDLKDLYNLLEHEILPLDLSSKVQPLLSRVSKLGGKLAAASSVPEVQLSLRLRRVGAVNMGCGVMELKRVIAMATDIASETWQHAWMWAKGIIELHSRQVKMRIDKLACELCGSEWVGGDLVFSAGCRGLSCVKGDLPVSSGIVSSFEVRKSWGSQQRKRVIDGAQAKVFEEEDDCGAIEREEESKRLKQQKTTEEAEQRRLAEEYTRREEQRIRREIEERERLQAEALILQKGSKKKGKRVLLDGEKVSKEALIEMAMSEHLKERQEMEKSWRDLQKLWITWKEQRGRRKLP